MEERSIEFSAKAKFELETLNKAVGEIIDKAIACYEAQDTHLAAKVEPLEEVIDLMRDELRNRHIERLKAGDCTIETGTQFLELLTNLERVADHCSNVAMYIIREEAKEGDPIRENSHLYLHQLHEGGSDEGFDKMYGEYKKQYYSVLKKPVPQEVPPMFQEAEQKS